MDPNLPLITVLMPVFNGQEYLKEAIDSILNQTYTNYEFLIINDGSTDNTENIILSYTDGRIRYIKNDSNIKLIRTLNKGLELAKGEFIVRMDADDISTPDRIEKQINALLNDKTIGAIGCSMQMFGDGYNSLITYSAIPDYIKFRMLFGCHIIHGASAFRTSVIRQNNIKFNEKYLHCEDHYFFWQVVNKAKITNLPDVLYLRRMSPTSVITSNKEFLKTKHNELRIDILSEIGVTLNEKEKAAYSNFILKQFSYTPANINDLFQVFTKITSANYISKTINTTILTNYFTEVILNILNNSTGLGLSIFKIAKKNELIKDLPNRQQLLVKIAIKSLIRKKYPIIQFSKFD